MLSKFKEWQSFENIAAFTKPSVANEKHDLTSLSD